MTINYHFYESFGCPNTFRNCIFFAKIIETAHPLTTLKLLEHRLHKLNSTNCSALTVIILEFGSIACIHSPFQNKTFQVYLSGTVKKKKNTHTQSKNILPWHANHVPFRISTQTTILQLQMGFLHALFCPKKKKNSNVYS